MSDHHTQLRRMAMQASNEDEDALLWALAEIERLRAELALYKQNYARKQLTDSERRELEGRK